MNIDDGTRAQIEYLMHKIAHSVRHFDVEADVHAIVYVEIYDNDEDRHANIKIVGPLVFDEIILTHDEDVNDAIELIRMLAEKLRLDIEIFYATVYHSRCAFFKK